MRHQKFICYSLTHPKNKNDVKSIIQNPNSWVDVTEWPGGIFGFYEIHGYKGKTYVPMDVCINIGDTLTTVQFTWLSRSNAVTICVPGINLKVGDEINLKLTSNESNLTTWSSFDVANLAVSSIKL